MDKESLGGINALYSITETTYIVACSYNITTITTLCHANKYHLLIFCVNILKLASEKFDCTRAENIALVVNILFWFSNSIEVKTGLIHNGNLTLFDDSDAWNRRRLLLNTSMTEQ